MRTLTISKRSTSVYRKYLYETLVDLGVPTKIILFSVPLGIVSDPSKDEGGWLMRKFSRGYKINTHFKQVYALSYNLFTLTLEKRMVR